MKRNLITVLLFTIALFCFAMAAFAEECESDVLEGRAGSCIEKPYEIENVLITFFWFDTEEEMQAYYVEQEFGPLDKLMRSFNGSEPYPDKNICHLDLYAVRPVKVDDDYTLSIGHEVIHCVHGPDYHVTW